MENIRKNGGAGLMVEKLTLAQVREMLAVIEELKHFPASIKFTYALARNRARLAPAVGAWEQACFPRPPYQEYDARRVEVCREFCLKDEGGAPRIEGQQFIMDPARREEFEAAMAELRREYAEALTDREAQLREAEALLEEPADVELYRLPLEHFPDGLTLVQMNGLMPMVAE